MRSCVSPELVTSHEARKAPVESQSDRPMCRSRIRVIGAPVLGGRSGKAGRPPRPHHTIRPCPKAESHARDTSDVPLAQMHKAQTDGHQQEQCHLKGKHDIISSTEGDRKDKNRKERLTLKLNRGHEDGTIREVGGEIYAQWSKKACFGKLEE